MDTQRIRSVIDVEALATKTVAVVGVGGGANLCRNLVRCGVRRLKLMDMDTVSEQNICRQEHMADQIGQPKVAALASELTRINPRANVEAHEYDFRSLSDYEIAERFADADLLLFCVDNLPANSRGNQAALQLGKPAVWSGLYPEGKAGEIVFWTPNHGSCYRCLCSHRYAAWEQGQASLAVSDGADVLAVQLLDSITGVIAIGLLTQGAANRYGRLIEQLGDRQFLQIKIDPGWNWNGRDIVQEKLQIPAGNDAYFGFCSIVRRNPDPGGRCPDCVRFRSTINVKRKEMQI
jgi:molybdopterin/thiamine biosynthesis adenylyltransferase